MPSKINVISLALRGGNTVVDRTPIERIAKRFVQKLIMITVSLFFFLSLNFSFKYDFRKTLFFFLRGSSSVNFTYNYRRFEIYLPVYNNCFCIFFYPFGCFSGRLFWNVMKILWKYNEKTLKIRSQLFYIRRNFGFLPFPPYFDSILKIQYYHLHTNFNCNNERIIIFFL